jgi:hypothetical protein
LPGTPLGHRRLTLDQALLPAGRLVQPGVLDRHAGRGTQRDQHGLVVLGELGGAPLIGQVQVAEHHVAHPDGTPRKLPIGGWPAGNPED